MVDIDLIKRCQREESDAFDLLYEAYSTKALRTACLLVGNRNIAEDIIQEAFIECFKDIKKLRNPETFEVWFHRLLVRVCWRMSSKERKSVCENLDDSLTETIPCKEDVFKQVEHNQTSHVIREAINKLSSPVKTTVILYYYNNLSIKEIAQIMKCFQGTVKSRLHNGRKLLAKELRNAAIDIGWYETDYLEKECMLNAKRNSI
ncbi:MAG: sigma-70 family RNA polymerase sigma factor [Clostridia bacterium]|nr:sigma-70 family RNA polymerase sigma factor [Clostridia bacterium]